MRPMPRDFQPRILLAGMFPSSYEGVLKNQQLITYLSPARVAMYG